MTFKVRRVTSGLLPQQHFLAKRFPLNSVEVATKHINDQVDTQPSHPETHNMINDTLRREYLQSGLPFSINLLEDARNSKIPMSNPSVGAGAKSAEPMDQSTMKIHPTKIGELNNEDAEFFRRNKLISEDNVFSPQSTAGRRFIQNRLLQKPDMEDLEFDPSDRDLPEKTSLEHSLNRSRNDFVSEEPLKKSIPEMIPSQTLNARRTELRFSVNTPQRSSPLRKVLLQDSVNTSTEDAVRSISQSSVVRPKTTKEIFDQINSSIERFKSSDNKSFEVFLKDLLDESDDEILQNLDMLLPARGVKDADQIDALKDSKTMFTQDKSPRTLESNVLVLGSPGQNKSDRSRGKYTRKNVRDNFKWRHQKKLKEYEAWTADKWAKLEALVALSVPNLVIINNKAVQSKLGCGDKNELAQRVKFLVKQTRNH